MKIRYTLLVSLLSFFIVFLIPSCGDEEDTPAVAKDTSSKIGFKNIGKSVVAGEIHPIKFYTSDPSDIKTLQLSIDGKEVFSKDSDFDDEMAYSWNTKEVDLGSHSIKLSVTTHSGGQRVKKIQKTILAKSPPSPKNIEIINKYPHDENAYTQGLEFDGDRLIEGTGQRGESNIREIDISSGKILNQTDMEEKYFGEGITVWGDELYQITWVSAKGFVYDKNTLELKKEFDFNSPTGEGWGLTHDSSHIIMSDGSHQLYFLKPDGLVLDRILEVYTDRGPLRNLNELEYIDGKIYANVYQTPYFVVIDPKTGAVEQQIDMRPLTEMLPAGSRAEVLNGIAYDHVNDRLYVTGKYWPYLFEIKIVN